MRKNYLVIEAGDNPKVELANNTKIACAVTVDFENFDGFGVLINVPRDMLEHETKPAVTEGILPAIAGAVMRAMDQWKESQGNILWEQFRQGVHSGADKSV